VKTRPHSAMVRTGAKPERILVEPASKWPRYWALAWQCMGAGKSRASSTEAIRLADIGVFYEHCDELFGQTSLDSAISSGDAAALETMAETFFLELSGKDDYTSADVQRWDSARGFLARTLTLIDPGQTRFSSVIGLLHGIGRMQLPAGGRFPYALSLPQTTLADLLRVASPDSALNPVINLSVRWRNWLMLQLLLQAGLRRGELLLLTLDSLQRDVSRTTGGTLYWLNVTEAEGEDLRSSKPSIKTRTSHRQVPVSEELAELVELYVAEFRPSGETNFLLTANGKAGLSKEAVDKNFQDLTTALSPEARQLLSARTGGRKWVSSHMPRHTCATVAYKLFMTTTGDKELTRQRMRAFFGWEENSQMPEHYARAAIQDDLIATWAAVFDRQISALRGLDEI